MRIANWTKLKSPELWQAWRLLFDSTTEAEVTAIWMANRLVKDMARSTKRALYEVKDMWIRGAQGWLVEGRIARVERRDCRDCGGSGDDGECERCDGTGIWSQRTLYCHYFSVDGRRYSFHSYQTPASISTEPGEDKEEYGGRFSASELTELALPMSGLLRMLRWHALAEGFAKGPPVESMPQLPALDDYDEEAPARTWPRSARNALLGVQQPMGLGCCCILCIGVKAIPGTIRYREPEGGWPQWP
jgi:hypothetical protein